VVDAFDAMTTSRPYRKAMPTAKALEVLQENAGTQFDPAIVEVFLQLVRSDPGLLPPDPESIVNLHGAVNAEAVANTTHLKST
jgi:HD-GYP domain-containing protein (c-di-GMP phosphodiesterase class II)